MDATALPKGHIIGWAPPPQPTAESTSTAKPLSKSAKKNAKRREKKAEKKEVPENWEEEEEQGISSNAESVQANGGVSPTKENVGVDHAQDTDPERDPTTVISTEDILSSKVKKMGL